MKLWISKVWICFFLFYKIIIVIIIIKVCFYKLWMKFCIKNYKFVILNLVINVIYDNYVVYLLKMLIY